MSEEVTPVKPEDQYVDSPERRNFMAALIGGASAAYAAGIGYAVFRYLTTGVENPDANLPADVKVDGAEALAKNSGKIFKFGSKPGLIIKDEAGEFHAFSAVCKHLGCTVSYQAEQKRIFCACHGGVYDPNTGKNISGPPPEPLDSFKVKVEKDGVFVTKA
jgi:cytochrome b6-f complex iron-sulfur subunit